ncbi:hypothetical protein G7Y79_00001g003690 [Physcia stellaris]|nr:hypothetical protein G7Y79_00001g003690 [Physcia stellaris]
MSGWTTEQDRDLLLTIIRQNIPKKGEWVTISEKFGHGKSGEACRQHFSKLIKDFPSKTPSASAGAPRGTKRKASDADNDASSGGNDEDGDATKEKVKVKAAAKPKAKPKAKAGNTEGEDEGDGGKAKPKAARGGRLRVRGVVGAGEEGEG